MKDEEKLEIWKRKLIKSGGKARELNGYNDILINLLNEVKTRQNIKLNDLLKDLVLKEESSYLDYWIKFHESKLSRYEGKIKALEKKFSEQKLSEIKDEVKLGELLEEKQAEKEEIKEEPVEVKKDEKVEIRVEEEVKVEKQSVIEEKPKIEVKQEETKKQIKELFEGPKGIRKLVRFKETLQAIREPIANIFKATTKLSQNKLVAYGIPIILLLLVTSVLFLSKPELTGYVTLTREETYDDNLGLVINESGTYNWTIDQSGDIESIKASGKVKGNGTVKIYIEKDGERYLIFDNKASG